MSCKHCETARARHGHYGGTDPSCLGCRARGIARSQAAWLAVHKRDNTQVRELAASCLAELPLKEALQLVWDWWQVDHPTGVTKA